MQGWGIVFLGGSGELALQLRSFGAPRTDYAYISFAYLPHPMMIIMDGRLDARVCNSTPEP